MINKILNTIIIVIGILWLFSISFGVAGIIISTRSQHLSVLNIINLYLFTWIWIGVLLGITIGFFFRIRWILPIALLCGLYFSIFDMDSLYLFSASSYTSDIFINKVGSLFDLVATPIILAGNMLWFLELWNNKGKKEYDSKNKYARYRIKLIPFLFITAWSVLLLGLLCSFWTTNYLYHYSNQPNFYSLLVVFAAAYFIVLFIVSWGLIYRQNWMVLLLLLATTFLIYPAVLNLHIVIWFKFSWWEILLLLLFSAAVFILELVCFSFEWLWVMEGRTARNLKKQRQSPTWAKIFVAALLLFALIRIAAFIYTEYLNLASLRQSVIYYLNPNITDSSTSWITISEKVQFQNSDTQFMPVASTS